MAVIMRRDMEQLYFVDTNVFVRFRDGSDRFRQRGADGWLRFLWAAQAGRLSTQVMSEYYVTVTEKLRPGLDREQARNDLRNLMSWGPVAVDRVVLQGAWGIQDRHGLSWWDALIVSAAQVAGCSRILTEDLEHGRDFDGVWAVDPSRTPLGG